MPDDQYKDTRSQASTGKDFEEAKANTLDATMKILRGGDMPDTDEILRMVKVLKSVNAFNLARRLLAKAYSNPNSDITPPLALKLAQEQAISTYKDTELPADARLNQALSILKKADDLNQTADQETLGLAGAIYKRKWEVDGQRQHLEISLGYYLRGYQQGLNDDGYTGINAAFLLDLLAAQEENTDNKAGSSMAHSRRQQAETIRRDIVDQLTAKIERNKKENRQPDYWSLVTLAEAHFGLRQYKQAEPYLEVAVEVPDVPPWSIETTAYQLARLALLMENANASTANFQHSEAEGALQCFLGGNAAAVRTAFLGKVGLALSGGGFRASLFHIGVLARLAELDMLRHVEVLSCVSGGSIIGAHYYLEVRKLLQEKVDCKIEPEDYIEIVKKIERDFLAGVQRNIRTRVLGDPIANLKMIFMGSYSRTMRVGELYESEIYSRVNDGEGQKERFLNELFIYPKGEKQNFAPKYDNWRRFAKVPTLILNATALNTGHNWQFTASFMGEPPATTDNEIDGNYRLRRMYYLQAPEDHKKMRLGYAVAASSCVPALFEPLPLSNLYPKKWVRLVDGGVHDNQGVAGLLDQNCTVLLVSDASGQMATVDDPSAGMLSVPLRSNSILQARVRESEYSDLQGRKRASLLRGLMFIHLKKDLKAPPVDWVNCDDPFDNTTSAEFYDAEGVNNQDLTSYGIMKKVQYRLSAIRTDLDSFSDTEAFALMTSGYYMTKYEFPRGVKGFSPGPPPQIDWRFLSIEKPMVHITNYELEHAKLMRLLDAGKNTAFKIWLISKTLKIISFVLAVIALAGLVFGIWTYRKIPFFSVGMIGTIMAVVIAIAIFGKMFGKTLRFRERLLRITIGLLLVVFGWIGACIHLLFFDHLFLRIGQVQEDEKKKAKAAG